MKTFEERYTAWIDGQLEGPALLAFEQELARRSAAGETEADRTDTLRLRHLLRDHLAAPALNNAEFFSHQLRERINAERVSGTRRPEGAAARGGLLALFPWSVARLAGLGAACLFVAGALYYGLEPGTTPTGGDKLVQATPAVPPTAAPPAPEVAGNSPAAPAPASNRADANQFAKISPTPAPFFDDAPDIQVHDDTSSVSATGLLYQKPNVNVNVLWTNGLPYLPDLAASPAPSPGANVVP